MALTRSLQQALPLSLQRSLYRLYPPNLLLHLEAYRQRPLLQQVERYCMFVGYGRSGHSLLGQMLNAHPEAVVAHEAHALLHLHFGLSVEQVYAWILKRDRAFGQKNRQWTNHNYRVPGLMQGDATRLRVIGDKKGGRTTDLLARAPELFDRLDEFGVPVRVIHHVRNPYDNISSMARRNETSLAIAVRAYFERVRNVQTHLDRFAPLPHVTVAETHHEDLVRGPHALLCRLLDFLGLEPSPAYLEACADVVFDSPNRSRDKVSWPPDLAAHVAETAAAFDFLSGYAL